MKQTKYGMVKIKVLFWGEGGRWTIKIILSWVCMTWLSVSFHKSLILSLLKCCNFSMQTSPLKIGIDSWDNLLTIRAYFYSEYKGGKSGRVFPILSDTIGKVSHSYKRKGNFMYIDVYMGNNKKWHNLHFTQLVCNTGTKHTGIMNKVKGTYDLHLYFMALRCFAVCGSNLLAKDITEANSFAESVGKADINRRGPRIRGQEQQREQ